MSATLTQAQLNQVAGLPSREAAEILGVGKTTVNRYRELARINGGELPVGDSRNHKVLHVSESGDGARTFLETRADGSLDVETAGDVPQDKAQIDAAMIRRGFDPEEYTFNYRFSEWQSQKQGGEVFTMYAARASATPKRVDNSLAAALDVTELLQEVHSWEFTPVIKDEFASADAVLAFADPQFGKTDANGGSAQTVNQVLSSFAAFAEICKEEKPKQILFADLGDGLENFYNTPMQRQTNDLELTEQVRVLRRIQAQGLRMLAPYCERLTHASVPSNHGNVRIAMSQQASTASDDWGLEVSCQLEDVFQESAIDVEFLRPQGKESLSLSVALESGTWVGMAHGDQASQNQLALWWMKQAFGWENPLREADLFLYGHHHNHALEEVYEGRWAIGCASSDRGSAWFTSKSGRSSTSGMTTFLTAERKFWKLDLV